MSKAEQFINTLLAEIDQCGLSKVSVELLSTRLGISRWQMQRTFQALTGMDVGDYLRQYRLSHAAKELVESNRRLLDIALDVGFESQESFSRAFKSHFKQTPREYRKAHNLKDITLKLVVPKHYSWSKAMKIKIVTKPAMTIIGRKDYFTAEGSDNANNFKVIPALWSELSTAMKSMELKPGQWLGYMTESDKPEKDELIYIAGFEKPAGFKPEGEGWVEVSIAEQNYAVVPHHGLLETLGDTLNTFYGQWFPDSGYTHGEECGIEMYDDRFDAESETSYFETWVPVVKV